MNERFAAVDERFIKLDAMMDSTKEQISLDEKNLNEKIMSALKHYTRNTSNRTIKIHYDQDQ